MAGCALARLPLLGLTFTNARAPTKSPDRSNNRRTDCAAYGWGHSWTASFSWHRQVVTTLMLHAGEHHIRLRGAARSSGVRGIAQSVTRASLARCHESFQRANATHPEELPYPPHCLRPLSGLAMILAHACTGTAVLATPKHFA